MEPDEPGRYRLQSPHPERTRYRTDNPKMVELQIGKPGIRAAAKESARFSLYLVVAVDVADYLLTLGRLYDSGLHKLAEAWDALGQEAEMRFRQLASSHMVHDLRQDASVLASKVGREADLVRGELAHLW